MPSKYLSPKLSLLLHLRDSWTETDPPASDIHWTTSPIDEPVVYPMIQVTMRQRTPSLQVGPNARYKRLNIGTQPVYWVRPTLFVDLYVKETDVLSNSSEDSAKNQRDNMIEEVVRILAYNPTGSTHVDNFDITDAVDADELQPRPLILHSRIAVKGYLFRTGSATAGQ